MDQLKRMLQTPTKTASTFCLYGKPGIGKTEFAAHFPRPLFIVDPAEDGIGDLINLGTVPKGIQFAKVQSFADMLALCDELASSEHPYKTIVWETIGGLEALVHSHTYKERQYTDQAKFDKFNEGARASRVFVSQWIEKMQALREKGIGAVLTAHAKVQRFSNPCGDDFDMWLPDCFKETWAPLAKWVGNIFFMTLDVSTEKNKADLLSKTKGYGEDRILHTTPNAAVEAKTRLKIPSEIPMGSSGSEAYQNFVAAVKGAK